MSLDLRRQLMATNDSRNKIVIVPSVDSPQMYFSGTDIVVKSKSCNVKYEICNSTTPKYPPIKAGEEVTILSHNITYFACRYVQEFTTIKNLSIKQVYLNNSTPLERIIITDCPELTTISAERAGGVDSGNLQSVDLSNCAKLATVNLSYNGSLSDLKLDNSNSITTLNINFTKVNSLDITNMLQLKDLQCASTKFNVLDTSKNENLETLKLGYLGYTSQVDTVDLSNNKKLKVFQHAGTNNAGQLPELDLSNNTELTEVEVLGTFPTLDVSNSPDITSLIVSSAYLTSFSIGNKPNIKTLSIKAAKITSVDVSQYTTLTSLTLGCNLQTIDISSLVNLTKLDLTASTSLSYVDTSNNAKLSTYSVYASHISRVDVSKNTALTSMDIRASRLRKVDLSTCPNITTFNCNNAEIVALNMIGCSKLNTISLQNNDLEDIRCSLSNTTFVNSLKTQLSTYGSGRAGTIYTDDDSSDIADVCASVGWSIKPLSEAPDFDTI